MMEAKSTAERSQMTKMALLQKALNKDHQYDITEDIKCNGE